MRFSAAGRHRSRRVEGTEGLRDVENFAASGAQRLPENLEHCPSPAVSPWAGREAAALAAGRRSDSATKRPDKRIWHITGSSGRCGGGRAGRSRGRGLPRGFQRFLCSFRRLGAEFLSRPPALDPPLGTVPRQPCPPLHAASSDPLQAASPRKHPAQRPRVLLPAPATASEPPWVRDRAPGSGRALPFGTATPASRAGGVHGGGDWRFTSSGLCVAGSPHGFNAASKRLLCCR